MTRGVKMEHAERARSMTDTDNTPERAYERYGWMILSTSALLGIVAAVVTTVPPLYVFSSGIFEGTYPIMGALGTAMVGFNVLALVLALILPVRAGCCGEHHEQRE